MLATPALYGLSYLSAQPPKVEYTVRLLAHWLLEAGIRHGL